MHNLIKQSHFLRFLSKITPQQRKSLLKTATRDQMYAICEICTNLLNGNLNINRKKLIKYKNPIRQIANKRISLCKKRKLLINQTGGFLPIILPAVLSAISGIVGKAIGNRI